MLSPSPRRRRLLLLLLLSPPPLRRCIVGLPSAANPASHIHSAVSGTIHICCGCFLLAIKISPNNTTRPSHIEAMLQRALLLACMLAMAQAQAKHIVYYNPSDECKNELCWQCARPLYLPIDPHLAHMSPSSSRYLIPFWLIAVLLIIVAVCCKMMYAM